MTARSTSVIRLSPSTTWAIDQFRPSRTSGRPERPGTEAVSQPGWPRSASSASRVNSARLFPILVIADSQPSLMTEAFQLFCPRFGHAAHTFAGIEPRDSALAETVIQAVGVAVLDPQPLRRTQLVVLRRHRVLQRLLIGNGHPLVPLRGLGLETLDHLEGIAVAGRFRIALIGVSTAPGATMMRAIPNSIISRRRLSANPSTACFDIE